MHERLSVSSTRDMLIAVAEHMVANTDYLTSVDQAIGDGDHGIGMRRGFTAVIEKLQNAPEGTVQSQFKTAGMAIMAKTGGAAGAVFGTFFTAGSAALADCDTMDSAHFARFLQLGLEGVEKRGGAKEGDKTMIDALAPAAKAAAAAENQSLSNVVDLAAEAAIEGVEASKNMIATTGKARTLGERSLGHPDPGAVSTSFILGAMRDFVNA